MNNVVISRYNKNVDFSYSINKGKINIIIYDKENPNNHHNIPVNKGNEASVYLKYIIDYYENLPEFTYFIHDDEYSWHHEGSIVNLYDEAINSGDKYYNVNAHCQNSLNDVISNCITNGWYEDFIIFYNNYIEEFVPYNSLIKNKKYRNSAQFLVHKDLISLIPKKKYIEMYNWIITTNFDNSKSGRFLEWTWHILWDIYLKK